MTDPRPIIPPGEVRELAGSREITYERTGLTGRKTFQVRWEDQSLLPRIGDPFGADSVGALLKCIRITVTGMGKTGTGTGDNVSSEYAYAECEYSTDLTTGDEPEFGLDFTTQASSQVIGRNWVTGQNPVEDEYPAAEGIVRYSVTVVKAVIPLASILATTNKVNSDTIWGFSPGNLLFEGATGHCEYDPVGNSRWRITFNFVGKATSHNTFWRKPVYVIDPDTNQIAIYQNVDPAKTLTYTTDAYLVGTQIPVAGTSGVAGWDTMDPPVYAEANFAAVFS